MLTSNWSWFAHLLLRLVLFFLPQLFQRENNSAVVADARDDFDNVPLQIQMKGRSHGVSNMILAHGACQFLCLSAHFVQHVLYRQKRWLQGNLCKRFHNHPLDHGTSLQDKELKFGEQFQFARPRWTILVQFMSPRTTSYLHTSSFLYQCLHQIACFMCVFHISKASPNKNLKN